MITTLAGFDANSSGKVNELQRVDMPSSGSPQTKDDALEADQSEVIRKAMSELGKRSAAARAKKRAVSTVIKS
jgi:hypothetical protein